jgi:hypothetical protein
MLSLLLLVPVSALPAETDFLKSLPADEYAAAGLNKLTPAELARLVAAVHRFQTVRPAAAVPVADAAADKKPPGWFAALLTLDRAGSKPGEAEPLESTLVGDFSGWGGRTVFRLENGTRWEQQNRSETYVYSPTLHSPAVKITPASLGGFWLAVAGVNERVRVKPLELRSGK